MMMFTKLVAATGIVLGTLSCAAAQSYAPQIPTPVNPAPLNPVATDGSSLPYSAVPAEGVTSGRSVGFGNGGAFRATPGMDAGTAGGAAQAYGSNDRDYYANLDRNGLQARDGHPRFSRDFGLRKQTATGGPSGGGTNGGGGS